MKLSRRRLFSALAAILAVVGLNIKIKPSPASPISFADPNRRFVSTILLDNDRLRANDESEFKDWLVKNTSEEFYKTIKKLEQCLPRSRGKTVAQMVLTFENENPTGDYTQVDLYENLAPIGLKYSVVPRGQKYLKEGV